MAQLYKSKAPARNLGVYAVPDGKGTLYSFRKASQELYEVFAIFVGAGGQRSQPEHRRRKRRPDRGVCPKGLLLPNIRPSLPILNLGTKCVPIWDRPEGLRPLSQPLPASGVVKGRSLRPLGVSPPCMPYIPTDWPGQGPASAHTGWLVGDCVSNRPALTGTGRWNTLPAGE